MTESTRPLSNCIPASVSAKCAAGKRSPDEPTARIDRLLVGQITDVPMSSSDLLVKPREKKYSSLPNIRIILYCFPSRPTKGALRNVNNAGRDAVDADVPLTNGADADGE